MWNYRLSLSAEKNIVHYLLCICSGYGDSQTSWNMLNNTFLELFICKGNPWSYFLHHPPSKHINSMICKRQRVYIGITFSYYLYIYTNSNFRVHTAPTYVLLSTLPGNDCVEKSWVIHLYDVLFTSNLTKKIIILIINNHTEAVRW